MKYKIKKLLFSVLIILLSILFIYFISFNKKPNKEKKIKSNDNIVYNIDDKTGINLLLLGNFKGAINYYNKKINRSKDFNLKMLYKTKKAYAIFTEGEALNKQEEYFEKGKKILDNIKNKQKEHYGEYSRVYGFGYEMTRDYKNALKMYTKALDIYKKDNVKIAIISTLGSIGHTYMLSGNPYEANKYLMMGYGLDKDNIFINRLLFRNFGGLGFKKEAMKFGEKLVNKLYPKKKKYNLSNLLEIYYGLSNLYLFDGKIKKSLELSQKCIQKDKKYSSCYVANARAYFYGMGKNGIPFAKYGISKAIKYNPTNFYAFELLAEIEEYEGNIKKALQIYKNNYNNIIDKDTNLFDDSKNINKQKTLINIISLYSKRGNIETAYKYLLKLKKMPLSIASLLFLENKILAKDSDLMNLIKNKDLSNLYILWDVYKNIKCQEKDKKCLKIKDFLNELKLKGKEKSCLNYINLINTKKAICKLIGFKH